MKKSIVVLWFLCAASLSYGQLNPVRNLTWLHWYVYPNNFYSLSWEVPLPSSTDTLAGYQVYRDDSLWRFQTATNLFCIENNCQDPGFLFFYPFWIKVTAVYNYNKVESELNDSVFDHGYAIGIQERANNMVHLLSNPVKPGEMIKFTVSETLSGGRAVLINSLGMKVCEIRIPSQPATFVMDSRGLPSGLYYLNIRGNNIRSTQKIMIN